VEGVIYALCLVKPDLPPQPPTLDDPDLDHSEYKEVLTAIMDNSLDAKLDKYREEREKLAGEVEANIASLRAELNEAVQRQTEDREAVVKHMDAIQKMFGDKTAMESH